MALESFFRPRSVAVIGASREPGKVGHEVFANLIGGGFKGAVYPVNPNAEEVLGHRCYPSLGDLPGGDVDLAVIVVPARAVTNVIEKCAEYGITAAIVITAGFRESGPAGAALEREMLDAARSGGVRVLGPNCLGIVSTPVGLNASFAATMPEAGTIAFLSQSGALGTAILDWTAGEGLGLSHFVSLGNRSDISEADLLSAWSSDPDTSVIVAYLESISDGDAFVSAARGVAQHKPVFVLKSGASDAGARAVSSHTGSLAGSDTAYDAAFRAAGVVRVDSVQELFDLAGVHARQPLPEGHGTAILTNAGGPAVIATDVADRLACELASLAPETIDLLRDVLPPAASLYNPVDILGDAEPQRYGAALRILLNDPGVHSVLVILTPQAMTDPTATAHALLTEMESAPLPVVSCFMGHESVADARAILTRAGVPGYPFPERAMRALASLHHHAAARSVPVPTPAPTDMHPGPARDLIAQAAEAGRTFLTEERAAAVAAAFGIRVPPGVVAGDLASAIDAAQEFDYPVVLKIASPEIIHKSDIGGIAVGISSAEELTTAYDTLMGRARAYAGESVIDGVHVQKMVPSGREVIVGVDRDSVFGPLIMFGLGGIYVEIMRDVTFRLCPVDEREAAQMVREIRSYALLRGARGQAPADIDAVVDAIVRLSHLAVSVPGIEEIDINPLIVGEAGEGVWAADVRIGIGGL